jgi:4-hydroxybenzoate polyprenyltransferase
MSSRELIQRYLVERARLGLFVALALVMTALDRWTAGPFDWSNGGRSAGEFAAAALTALLLMLAFRIWDDIEDRQRDAHEHPQRVTVVADSVTPLAVLALVVAIAGVSIVALGPRAVSRLGVVGAAGLVIGGWYRLRPGDSRGVANGHVVLLKYPAIAYAMSPVAPPIAVIAAVYLAICVYEVVGDPTLRASHVARRIAMSESVLVSFIVVAATFFRGRFS